MSAGWSVRRARGSAAEHHARVPRPGDRREVWLCRLDAPALVLGSGQPDDVVDHEQAGRRGLAVVRRRSGGGAVLLEPGEVLWLDVVVPRGDTLWSDDVRRAVAWVGAWWQAALAEVGVAGEVVMQFQPGRWGSLVCFAGRGPGEVLTAGGAKVVGCSQRRTAAAAHIQTVGLARWRPTELLDLLALEPSARHRAAVDLEDVAAGIAAPLDDVEAALLDLLP